jgi:hypothetical protein
MRARSPNRIGANPVAAKAHLVAPARGRLSNRGSAFGPQPEPPGPLYPQAPGGGFYTAPGQVQRGNYKTTPYSRESYATREGPGGPEGTRGPIPGSRQQRRGNQPIYS